MGLSTVTAGRIFKGQQEGGSGEESYLSFEKFPNVGLLKVNTLFFCTVLYKLNAHT